MSWTVVLRRRKELPSDPGVLRQQILQLHLQLSVALALGLLADASLHSGHWDQANQDAVLTEAKSSHSTQTGVHGPRYPTMLTPKQRKRKALSTATSENSNMTTSLRLQLLLGTQITANRFSYYLESAPVTAADPTLTTPWTSLRTFHLGPLRYGLEVGSGRCDLLLGVLARLHVDVLAIRST